MKKAILVIVVITLIGILAASLTGCGLFEAITGKSSDGVEQLFDECTETNGKWICYDFWTKQPTDTYFVFNGTKNVMHFEYYVDGVLNRDGVYRVVYRGEGEEVSSPLSIGFEIKGDNKRRDWIHSYVDDFKTDFTQFTVMLEDRDEGLTKSGTPRWYVYRLGDLPFRYGYYVKEGSQLKEDKNNYMYADRYFIPSGEYVHESGAKLTFAATHYKFGMMFRYEYNGKVVDGIYEIGEDKDKIFTYFNGHHPACGLTTKEAEKYGNLLYFPPNYNIYGNFDVTANTQSVTISRFEAIDGYDYDTGLCDWQIGTYTFVPTNNQQQQL